ncbi:MAG: T9SS type A sorting domain-containing protein [Flavobacteriales bacterium]|nr:T9SS type A sorting domain-containing protein [Flavobacteriales bacterium]
MRWLALFSIVIALPLRAQVHVPLFDEPARVWTSSFSGTVTAICMDTWTTSFWLSGDTIMNDTTYQKVVSHGLYYESYINAPPNACTTSYFFNGQTRFVREFERKVYARHANASERLIYDFTAEVGDTIPFPSNAEGYQEWGVVSAIDSVEVNGTYRKRFIIPEIPGFGNGIPHVIEGIGGCTGPFNELYGQMGLSHGTHLNCVVEHGVPIYGDTFCPNYTRIENVQSAPIISIAPNPSTGQFVISGVVGPCALEVFDSRGGLLRQLLSDQIDLSDEPSGLYHLRVLGPNGRLFSSHRLVVQH